ncbi:MAG: EamA family transporter, partial [Candidatus Limiplasma sp.]|nr:EamA family transporter [Candidatus Limiplasma sp.]
MKRSVRANLLLTLTALIWGAAFVAQDVAADTLGALTFNGLRMALAALAMLPVVAFNNRKARKNGVDASFSHMSSTQKRTLLTGGICCGAMLALASAFQQTGIAMGTGAGKAGF